jgi:hypothetical protein
LEYFIKTNCAKIMELGILDAGCWMLDTGYWILDAGYWILDAGYWMLDADFPIQDMLLS